MDECYSEVWKGVPVPEYIDDDKTNPQPSQCPNQLGRVLVRLSVNGSNPLAYPLYFPLSPWIKKDRQEIKLQRWQDDLRTVCGAGLVTLYSAHHPRLLAVGEDGYKDGKTILKPTGWGWIKKNIY